MRHLRLMIVGAGLAIITCCGLATPDRLLAQAEKQLNAAARSRGNVKMDERTGVAVGEKVPPFRLKDQDGRERSLAEWLEKGNVALVFHRSADW